MAFCNSAVLAKSRKNLISLPLTGVLQNSNSLSLNNLIHSKGYTTQEKHRKHQQPNHYNVLGVTPKATTPQIKHAYYKLSKLYHPDKNKSLTAQLKFQEIQTAYEILGNPKLRQEYDGLAIPSKAPFVPKVKHPWKTASHPTGRSAYNFDEHINQHYSFKLKLHHQIKEDTKMDREHREKIGYKSEEPWFHKMTAAVVLLGALMYVYLLPLYDRKKEDMIVKKMLSSHKQTDNKIDAEISR